MTHYKENNFLLSHKTPFFKQGATPHLYISGFGGKDNCVWPCDISCIANSHSVCLLPEIGTVSYLSSHHSYHMIARAYLLNKYLLRSSVSKEWLQQVGCKEGIKQRHSNNLLR